MVLDRRKTILVTYFDWLADDFLRSCDRSFCSRRLIDGSLTSWPPPALDCSRITLYLDHHFIKPEVGGLRGCHTGADHFSVEHSHLQITFHLRWDWDVSDLLWAFRSLRYQVWVLFFWRDGLRFFDGKLEGRFFLALKQSCQVELILTGLSSLNILVLKRALTEWRVLINASLESGWGIPELCVLALLVSHDNRWHWTSLAWAILLWAWWFLRLSWSHIFLDLWVEVIALQSRCPGLYWGRSVNSWVSMLHWRLSLNAWVRIFDRWWSFPSRRVDWRCLMLFYSLDRWFSIWRVSYIDRRLLLFGWRNKLAICGSDYLRELYAERLQDIIIRVRWKGIIQILIFLDLL